jgi:ferredoxin-NADP reductase
MKAARALTTPLLPDDYLELLNPEWSTRELRGRIEEIRPETEDASTVVIDPFFDWIGHWPGQYLRIGVEVDGVRHWRAYTLTSDPDHPRGLISITTKRVEDGKLSPWFTDRSHEGEVVFLGGAEGTFRIPHPVPDKLLMISAGSGVTPIWAHLRSLARRNSAAAIRHLHCCREPDDFIFGSRLRELDKRHRPYGLIEHHSRSGGRIKPEDIDEICPDWRRRATFLSGPREMLDAFEAHWEAEGDSDLLEIERFQPIIGGDATAEAGAGGSIRFRVTECETDCDGQTPILEAGEQAGAKLPFGCRMGVCHTCIGRLEEGRVRDLRSGRVHGEAGEMVRTCVNAPEGHVEIDL